MTAGTARRMIGAETLKLRRNRSVMAFAALLTVGAVVIFMGYAQIRHASNAGSYPPAGGLDGFRHALRVLGVFFGALAAILIGAESGTADLSSGVFRDLVATGRSRLALFFVRVPAALLVTLAFAAAGYGLALLGTYLFAGSRPTPSAGVVLQGAGWLALAMVVVTTIAVGVGSLSGSLVVTLTAVIGLETVLTQIVVNVSSLGAARDVLPSAALGQLIPVGSGIGVAMAPGIAVAVLAGWIVAPATLGAWRTCVRDA